LSNTDSENTRPDGQSDDEGVIEAVTEKAQEAGGFVARLGSAFTSGVRDAREEN
jgi:hypothetical protein